MIGTDDPAYSEDLARRIGALILADHETGGSDRARLNMPVLVQALAIVAARLQGEAFDQGSAEQRHLYAQALGATFASVAEAIWQHEASIWPESGSRTH